MNETKRMTPEFLRMLVPLILARGAKQAQQPEAEQPESQRGGWRRDGVFERPKGSGVWWVRFFCTRGCPFGHRIMVGPKGLALEEHGRQRRLVRDATREGREYCPMLEREARKTAREKVAQEREALFHTVAEKYLAWSATARRSHPSVRSWMKPLVVAFGDRSLGSLTEGDLLVYREARLREGASRVSVNRELGLLSSVFGLSHKLADQWGVPRDPHRGNPVRGLGRFDEPKRVRYLKADERARFLAALLPDVRAAAVLTCHTGLRRGELLGLHWRDVDLDAGVLTLPRTKSGTEQRVRLNTVAVETLRALPRLSPRVFSTLTARGLRREFEKARVRAGIEDLHWHDLRHDFASQLVMKGESIYTVRDLLRHSDVRVTQRYAHLSPDHLKAAVERLVGDETIARSGTGSGTEKVPVS